MAPHRSNADRRRVDPASREAFAAGVKRAGASPVGPLPALTVTVGSGARSAEARCGSRASSGSRFLGVTRSAGDTGDAAFLKGTVGTRRQAASFTAGRNRRVAFITSPGCVLETAAGAAATPAGAVLTGARRLGLAQSLGPTPRR